MRAATTDDLLGELGSLVDRTADLVAAMRRRVGASAFAGEGGAGEEYGGAVERELVHAVEERDRLSAQLASTREQTDRLMNLYVATYQLHATLDPGEVRSTIAEIATNLLGAERFVLLLKEDAGYEVSLAVGLDHAASPYSKGQYRGGDPLLDASLAANEIRTQPPSGDQAVAAVPLAAQGACVGALVVLKLFDHKAGFLPEDREILDLLAAHAASALVAARAFSNAGRKLRTLESLVQLVRTR